MLDIRNQAGDQLLLEQGTTLLLEQAAGLLDTDTLPGGFSYPVSFPLANCPQNARFVGQSHRPAASTPMELPVRLLVDGGLYRQAVLRYKVDNGNGSGTLRLDYSATTDELGRMSLVDALPEPFFMGGGVGALFAARMGTIAQMNPGTYPLTFFPLRNEGFMEEDFAASSLIGVPSATYQRPQYVNGMGPTGQFLTESLTGTVGRPIVPFFYLTWVVSQLIAKFGYRLAGSWAADENAKRLVIVNMTAMRSTARAGASPDGIGQISEYWCRPGLHLPDTTVAEFLKSVRERYGLFFRWDSRARVCYVDRFGDLLLQPAVDLRGARYLDSASLTDASRQGYKVYEYVEGSDALRKDAEGQTLELAPVSVGNGKNEVKLRVGTTAMIREVRPGSGTPGASWDLPTMRCAGNLTDPDWANSDRYLDKQGKRKNSLGLIVLSYVGLNRDSKGAFYPFATPFPADRPSVTLDGRNGGWVQGLRSVFSFRAQARELTQSLLLPVAQAASLLPGTRLQLRDPQGSEATGLLDKIQVELPARSGYVKTRLTTQLLPPIGESPAPALRPVVYVELKQVTRQLEEKRVPYPTPDYPQGGITADILHTWATLTVYVWADAAKTQPAVLPDELTLTLRVKETNDATARTTLIMTNPNPDYTRPYTVRQAVAVIEAQYELAYGLILFFSGSTGRSLVTLRNRTVQLEPGEGYQVL